MLEERVAAVRGHGPGLHHALLDGVQQHELQRGLGEQRGEDGVADGRGVAAPALALDEPLAGLRAGQLAQRAHGGGLQLVWRLRGDERLEGRAGSGGIAVGEEVNGSEPLRRGGGGGRDGLAGGSEQLAEAARGVGVRRRERDEGGTAILAETFGARAVAEACGEGHRQSCCISWSVVPPQHVGQSARHVVGCGRIGSDKLRQLEAERLLTSRFSKNPNRTHQVSRLVRHCAESSGSRPTVGCVPQGGIAQSFVIQDEGR